MDDLVQVIEKVKVTPTARTALVTRDVKHMAVGRQPEAC